MRALLLEPGSGGRISGGYIYNAKIVERSHRIERRALRTDQFEADLAALSPPEDAWLILDSLFLNRAHMAAFERQFGGSGQRRAVLLHALPSFIQSAEDREVLAAALPLQPSAEELQLLATLDLLIAPGPYLPRLLVERGATVPTVICSPGVDPAPGRAPRDTKTRPVQLVSIGSVTPLKGFLDAAEALGQLGSADFHWTIIGHLGVAPEYSARLRQRTRDLGLGDRVQFAGQLDHDATLAALHGSDLLLITSFTENHPLVALEALAASVPIVGYAVGALPDMIRQGEAGSLSPLLDIRHLSAQLGRLIADASERQRLAEGCARVAAELPSWADAARHFERALESHTV